MLTLNSKGSFKKTEKFLKKSFGKNYKKILEKYAKQGVEALSNATPINTGLTSILWDYEIIQDKSSISICWNNGHVINGVNIALILQYGHGTRNGGYVEGIDYINPALKPIFEELADAAWKEVRSL